MRAFFLLCLALCLGLGALSAAHAQETPTAADLLKKRAGDSVNTLAPLLETRELLRAQIAEVAADLESAIEADKAELSDTLQDLKQELSDTEDQISVLATGISERAYDTREPESFDLQDELQSLVAPFIAMMKSATEEARQIESTRRALDDAEQRASIAERALITLDAVQEATEDPAILGEIATRREIWQGRVSTSRNQVAALKQQLDDLMSDRTTAGSKLQTAVKDFFRERGLSLILGIGAFVLVLTVSRLAARLAGRLARRRRLRRSFQTRLANLIFTILTIAASFAAMLIVFNLRNDWLLLGLAALLLIALVWIGIRMLPGLVEQVTLLLNLGAVQEEERVVFDGVPYRVARLDFYTDLVNPALDGGTFTVPVRQLIGLHSRPEAEDEAWFPSKKDDWVKLADGHAGQVIAQTPEMVVLELPGGARVTYQTSDYLAQTPINLSRGYRSEIVFGIGYAHQAEATGRVIEVMKRRVTELMIPFVGHAHVRSVGVEFLAAGASSLDYEVEVDLTGSAAHRFEDIERELARVLVQIATEEGWEIPFQQIVMHHA
ncbi:MAG: hypothetical protein AAFR17_12590 [Pseudomonadota bacterium]